MTLPPLSSASSAPPVIYPVHLPDSPATLLAYPPASPANTLTPPLAVRPPVVPPSTIQLQLPEAVWQQLIHRLDSDEGSQSSLDEEAFAPDPEPIPDPPSKKADAKSTSPKTETTSIKDPDDLTPHQVSRKLVRQLEVPLERYLKDHPDAAENLTRAEEKLLAFATHPDDALESMRDRYKEHFWVKGLTTVWKPLIRWQIKQLPDPGESAVPFLNNRFVRNAFDFVTESDKAHDKRSQSLFAEA